MLAILFLRYKYAIYLNPVPSHIQLRSYSRSWYPLIMTILSSRKMAPVISHFLCNTLLILYKENNKNGFVVDVVVVNFYIGWSYFNTIGL